MTKVLVQIGLNALTVAFIVYGIVQVRRGFRAARTARTEAYDMRTEAYAVQREAQRTMDQARELATRAQNAVVRVTQISARPMPGPFGLPPFMVTEPLQVNVWELEPNTAPIVTMAHPDARLVAVELVNLRPYAAPEPEPEAESDEDDTCDDETCECWSPPGSGRTADSESPLSHV